MQPERLQRKAHCRGAPEKEEAVRTECFLSQKVVDGTKAKMDFNRIVICLFKVPVLKPVVLKLWVLTPGWGEGLKRPFHRVAYDHQKTQITL